MHYTTFFPDEQKLVLYQHYKGHPVKVLEVMDGINDQGNAILAARENWKLGNVLVKRGVKAPVIIMAPKEPVKPVLTDEEFFSAFPKTLHSAMRAAAKRNKASVQEIFTSCHKEIDGSHTTNPKLPCVWIYLNEGWDVYDMDPAGGCGTIHEDSLLDCLPYFKSIARSKA